MKKVLLLLSLAAVTACGGSGASAPSKTPADQSDTPAGAAAAQGGENANRLLDKNECDELAAWIYQVCHDNTTRSAEVDGWCTEHVAKADDGSFQSNDCAKHIKVIDNMCFRTTHSSRGLMDCDRSVNRE